MATTAFTAAPTSNTDANWRLWINALHTALTGVGLVDTGASGGINLATTTKPTGANTFRSSDFKVYRFDDALQATYPGFLKLEFGSGNGSADTPAIRLSAGTTHDGAGTLTGTQVTSALQCGGSTGTPSASLMQCWASGATGRAVVAMFADNTGNQQGWVFGFERTKDASGADNGDGLVLFQAGLSGGGNMAPRVAVVPPTGGMPPVQLNWPMPVPLTAGGFAAGANVDYPVALLFPHKGRALRPVLGVAAVHPTDMPTYGSTLTIDVYGTAHTYLSIGNIVAVNGAACSSTNPQLAIRALIRYE